jgi:signal transduction histidine kinase
MTATSDPVPLPAWLIGRAQGAEAVRPDDGRVQDAEERVRLELARELHDQVVQELTSTLIDLENFKRQPFDADNVAVQVDQVQGSLRRTLRELRQLLYDLRDEEGWQPTFTTSLRDFGRRYTERTGVRVTVEVNGEWPSSIRLPAAQQLQRIVHEAVNNARLHGGAHTVTVYLGTAEDVATVRIRDDGRGFETDYANPQGMGVLGMRERAALLGGSLRLEAGRPTGTVVCLDIPRSVLT